MHANGWVTYVRSSSAQYTSMQAFVSSPGYFNKYLFRASVLHTAMNLHGDIREMWYNELAQEVHCVCLLIGSTSL